MEYVEPPVEIKLTFDDGTSRTQWGNARLWNLYRGASVGPDVLKSLLMALERWLFEFAEARPRELDAALLHLLKQSNSSALTAVVASIATAFPHASGETILVLLESPPYILLDRQRLGNESQASMLSRFMIPEDTNKEFYASERTEANARPHRSHDLETAIINLQLGPLAPRVREILDRHRAEMPPVEEQDEGDRLWRLAIHRMDLRQYTIAEGAAENPIVGDDSSPPAGSQQYVRLDLKEPDPDIKELTDQSAERLQAMNAKLGLLMWGINVFDNEDVSTYDPAQWQQRLKDARTVGDKSGNYDKYDPGRGGPGLVAAVCVRDHWEEMSSDDREWCVSIICSEIERDGNTWDHFERVQRGGMEGHRPSAEVLPLLLGKSLEDKQLTQVRQTLVIALTHAVDEVRRYAASGIGKYLWAIDRDLTLRCVNTLATEATLVQESIEKARSQLLHEKQFSKLHSPGWVDSIEADVASTVRIRFFEVSGIPDDALYNFDSTRWVGTEANGLILTILGQASTEAATIAAFQRLATILVQWWDTDDNRHPSQQGQQRERNYELEADLRKDLEAFVLRIYWPRQRLFFSPF